MMQRNQQQVEGFHDVAFKNLADAGFEDRILWHRAARRSRTTTSVAWNIRDIGGRAERMGVFLSPGILQGGGLEFGLSRQSDG
jgi:hypothetical protein